MTQKRITAAFVLRHLKANPNLYLTPNQTKNARSKRWYTFEDDNGFLSCVGSVKRSVVEKLVGMGKLWRVETKGKVKYFLFDNISSTQFKDGKITVPIQSAAYEFLSFSHNNSSFVNNNYSECEQILAHRLNKIRQHLNG
jgi:hypothetical protein